LITQLCSSSSPILKTSPLYPIYKKVKNRERISESDAASLFASNDILEIGIIANLIRQRHNKNNVYYILNGHINYSNICVNSCSFCSFKKKSTDKSAYEMSLNAIQSKLSEFNQQTIQEIHIVGGLHPQFPFSYYLDILKSVREVNPNITIKAFTAVEIAHFAHSFKMSIRAVLSQLIECGLEMLPGGGAEIFAEDIRQQICPDKISATEWLEVHKTAHELGIKSNATMLFGHIESFEHRIDHLKQLRHLQDQTDGFLALIPLTYHPKHNPLSPQRTSGLDELKTIAISRIYLDNFPHIKAYWVMLGLKMAQTALSFGADDLDGTVLEEKITHSAGAMSPELLSRSELNNLILECQKIPLERDSFYKPVSN